MNGVWHEGAKCALLAFIFLFWRQYVRNVNVFEEKNINIIWKIEKQLLFLYHLYKSWNYGTCFRGYANGPVKGESHNY